MANDAPIYDELILLAGELCDCPAAFLSVGDSKRQRVVASYDIDCLLSGEPTQGMSFVPPARDAFYVVDVTKDDRFYLDGVLKVFPQIRFFAQAPLIDGEGNWIGSLCVADVKCKGMPLQRLEALKILSYQVVAQLELEKKKVIQELQEQELRYRDERNYLTIEGSPDAFVAIDDLGYITEWNRAAESTFGWPKSEVIGKEVRNILVPPYLRDFFDRLLKEGRSQSEDATIDRGRSTVSALKRDGDEIPIEVTIVPIHGPFGWQYCAFLRDISDLVKAELSLEEHRVKLLSTSKLSALGEMAAGIAHEINNPLAIIRGKAQVLRRGVSKGALVPEDIAQIADQLEATVVRIAKIINGLRSFARDGEGDPFEEVPIKKIVEETLEFCRARFQNNGVDLIIGEISDEWVVYCRPVQISQVLLNLLNNAFDAVLHIPEKWVKVELARAENDICLSVTDSGTGIPDDIREKIMQPFFTTKEVGKGTGLGLSLARGIIEGHKGRFSLDMASKNTKFLVHLPLVINEQKVAV